MTKNIIIAVRGQGSHYEKLRHILDSFSHDIEFIFLSRDSRTWLADLIGRTPSAVLLLVPNSLLLSYSLDARKYWPDSVLYCEKPFFNSLHHFSSAFDLIGQGRCMLGLNLRSSSISKIIDSFISEYNLGSIASISLSVSYPFAFREVYHKSWKSHPQYSPLGVFENLAIHYLDFLNYNYSIVSFKSHFSFMKLLVPCTYDAIGQLNNGASFTLHCSYAEQVSSHLIVNCTNGQINICDTQFSITSPTVTIDPDTGRSCTPPIIYRDSYGLDAIFSDSLRISMKNLLEACVEAPGQECEHPASNQQSNLSYCYLLKEALMHFHNQ